ncbi:hypothetical protein [Pseudoalteromonas spongiae]|uniref:hypothetical protein n=1 Tax=Pseudoalteromonas spongiae TaxID=298657 RepID=UPI000C2CF363|nr:hypothetical protein [Pseudoalteromonas spongiae]
MLTAILNNKAGRIEQGGESLPWRDVFKTYEDLLTATVFERFNYLSQNTQNQFISFLLEGTLDKSTLDLGRLINIEYWPRFSIENNSQSSVEPDLILCFENANVLIEVKPPSGGGQYYAQWEREVSALKNNSRYTNKKLYFVALGGVNEAIHNDELTKLKGKFSDFITHANILNWQQVASFLLNDCEGCDERDTRIINDIIAAIGLYGVNTLNLNWQQLQSHSFKVLSLQHNNFQHAVKNTLKDWQPLTTFTSSLNKNTLNNLRTWKNSYEQ